MFRAPTKACMAKSASECFDERTARPFAFQLLSASEVRGVSRKPIFHAEAQSSRRTQRKTLASFAPWRERLILGLRGRWDTTQSC
jgi:hypothetical protein